MYRTLTRIEPETLRILHVITARKCIEFRVTPRLKSFAGFISLTWQEARVQCFDCAEIRN